MSRFGGGGSSSGAWCVFHTSLFDNNAEALRFFEIDTAGTESGVELSNSCNPASDLFIDLWTINVDANAKTGTVTFNIRIGLADSGMTIPVGAGLTGIFQDLVNSDTLVALEDLCGSAVMAGSGAGLTIGIQATSFRARIV